MLTVRHDHLPLYRVVRAGWADPLDVEPGRRAGGRWNKANAHAVLYTCCGVSVARAIDIDVFRLGAFQIDDLRPEYRPVLAELRWTGTAIDLASAEGLVAAGFPLTYPDRVAHQHTQPFGAAWFSLGAEGVLCRSASVFRVEHQGWPGSHENWSELAIFTENAVTRPELLRVRAGGDWLA